MELRPYQKEAKEAIFEQWDSGVLKTLLVLPTGCGKTVVFAKVTEECVRQGDRVLILAHRGELLEQAADKLMKTTGLGCALEKAESSCQGSWFRVVVGSVQTLMREKRLNSFDPFYFNTFQHQSLSKFQLCPGCLHLPLQPGIHTDSASHGISGWSLPAEGIPLFSYPCSISAFLLRSPADMDPVRCRFRLL